MSHIEARDLEGRIAGEVLTVVGWSADGWFGRALVGLISRSVRRFAEVAATCDRLVAKEGFVAAGRWTLLQLASSLRVEQAEHVPVAGPVLIVCNHPGSVDALALVASSGRDDLKILAWPMPFLQYLPNVSRHLVFASEEKTRRAGAAREGIRHLAGGGALLLFARGQPEPDPATMSGAEAELRHWSRSIELFLRAVPHTTVVPAIVGGVLAPRFVHHPLTWVRRGRLQRQRMAIVLQFIHQMWGKRIPLVPRVTFGEPLSGEALLADPVPAIIASARELLTRHTLAIPLSLGRNRFVRASPDGGPTAGCSHPTA